MEIQWDRIDIPQDKGDRDANSHFWLTTNYRLFTFAVAIALHGILIISAALFVTVPASDKKQPVPRPVQARLVVAPPVVSDSMQTEPTGAEQKTTSETDAPDKNTPQTDKPPVEPTVKPAEKAPSTNTASSAEPPPVSATQSVSTNNVKKSAASVSSAAALNNYFSRHNELQISELGKTDSREARHRQRHPSLIDPRKGEPRQDESTPKVRRLRCDRIAGEVVATLSSIAGGTLRCSSEAQLAPHINKRLEEAGATR